MNLRNNKFKKFKQITKQAFSRLGSIDLSFSHNNTITSGLYDSPPAVALRWIKNHELSTGGIRVHSTHINAYPEVTGYLIPTLLEYGEKELAKRLANWLICIQRANGSFTDHNGRSYIFDTGQVLRGLLEIAELLPDALESAERAADYLCRQILNNGGKGFCQSYAGHIPESVHLYVLQPLFKAANILSRPDFQQAAERCLDYYCQSPDTLRQENLTHYLGYELEALIDLDRGDLAANVLEDLKQLQADDGSLRGKDGVIWICTPGLAQLAICWYKLGECESADRAMRWLEAHQLPSGGFFGSCGRGADYFPDAEISWAVKFYLDAHKLQVLASFAGRFEKILFSEVSVTDGRAQAISEIVQSCDRVIEMGCGKGRFLKMLRQIYPDIHCAGLDISPELLAQMPEEIERIGGSLESVQCPDNSFDVVFSVEAIEHSANPEAAVAEMIRVARPGGWVCVIDKQHSHWGRKVCPSWERWPDADGLKRLIGKGCDRVSADPVAYNNMSASDGLMVAWRGKKRSRLTGSQWRSVLTSPLSRKTMIKRLRENHISEWGQVILQATSLNAKVLEVGCGTGEISLHLAQAGRRTFALDIEIGNLKLIQNCADDLGVMIKTIQADATRPLPFADNEFCCTWSSGLLEHFSKDEIKAMLREQVRITSKTVIAIVPNAASVAYRAGKTNREKQGNWQYGLEIPILSLREEFGAVGINSVVEFTVGAKQSLSFLPEKHPLRKTLSNWMQGMSAVELQDCHQGYLLVSIGQKRQGTLRC